MLKYIAVCAGGILIGASVTYLLLKKKFEHKADKEIAEVRNVYLSKCRKVDDISRLNIQKEAYKSIIKNESYINNKNDSPDDNSDLDDESDDENDWETEKNAPIESPGYPYTITPRDFAYTNRHYDKITLLYYPNEGALINETDGIQEDIRISIGEDALTKFGEYEEDVAYVRNDRLGIDYEVLLQPESEHYIFEEESS